MPGSTDTTSAASGPTQVPQQALFVPGVWLQEGQNEVVVLEIELSVKGHPLVWFHSKPDFSSGRLGKRGGRMLGGLPHQVWMLLHGRGRETFTAMDTMKRQIGVMWIRGCS